LAGIVGIDQERRSLIGRWLSTLGLSPRKPESHPNHGNEYPRSLLLQVTPPPRRKPALPRRNQPYCDGRTRSPVFLPSSVQGLIRRAIVARELLLERAREKIRAPSCARTNECKSIIPPREEPTRARGPYAFPEFVPGQPEWLRRDLGPSSAQDVQNNDGGRDQRTSVVTGES
jgi:hypothetical protein